MSCLTEYAPEECHEMFRREGFEEGFIRGYYRVIFERVHIQELSPELASKYLYMPENEFRDLFEAYNEYVDDFFDYERLSRILNHLSPEMEKKISAAYEESKKKKEFKEQIRSPKTNDNRE